jgi:hypothetical protein
MIVQLVPRHGQRQNVQMLERSLLNTAPFPAREVTKPDHDPQILLVMYGPGSPDRTAMINSHLLVGGKVVCFDRGYLGRSSRGDEEHYRIAINRLHVSPEHIEGTSDDPSRFNKFNLSLRNDFRDTGQVVVAGLGPKSRKGLNLFDWERNTLQSLKDRFPGRRIVYRPKYAGAGKPFDGVRWPLRDNKRKIEEVLRGASLAVVRHSNVAIDACIAGVPVECEDGAAVWLYRNGAQQSEERRRVFLNKLAWWNWRADEMAQAWKFLLPRLS